MINVDNKMTLGSLFDGSGGFPLAGILNGITPVWASEVEPFPIKVTRKNFPNIQHLGDINKLDGAKIPPVNIITFGSPCQDMSIARGKRDGLTGNKSSLFFEAIRVIKEMREATRDTYPRFIVWENVQGAFSSNKGEDFRHVLESICNITDETVFIPRPDKWSNAGAIMGKGYSIAWRLLDAQYWGVPQRRKRIYLVADFGGTTAPEILFKSEVMQGNFEACGKSGEGVTEGTERCIDNAVPIENHPTDGRFKICEDGIIPTISQRFGTGGNNVHAVMQYLQDSDSLITFKVRCGKEGGDKGFLAQENKAFTLSCSNDQNVFSLLGNTINRTDTAGANGKGVCENVSYTLNTVDRHTVAYGLNHAVYSSGYDSDFNLCINKELQPTILSSGIGAVYTSGHSNHLTRFKTDVASCLTANDYKDAPVVMSIQPHGRLDRLGINKISTLTASDHKSPLIINTPVIRRLTPLECCRLQGFPDDWCKGLEHTPDDTELEFWRGVFQTYADLNGQKKRRSDKQIIKWLSSPHTDSAEYKMWGNGIALPCAEFVLHGIAGVLA